MTVVLMIGRWSSCQGICLETDVEESKWDNQEYFEWSVNFHVWIAFIAVFSLLHYLLSYDDLQALFSENQSFAKMSLGLFQVSVVPWCSSSMLFMVQWNKLSHWYCWQAGQSPYALAGMLLVINIEQLIQLFKDLANLNWCLVISLSLFDGLLRFLYLFHFNFCVFCCCDLSDVCTLNILFIFSFCRL